MSDDDDLAARLRAADPAASLPPADADRVDRLLEDAMSDDTLTESRVTGTRQRSPLTWLVAAAAAVLIAGTAVFALSGRGGTPSTPPSASEGSTTPAPAPTVLELTVAAGAGTQRCMVPTAEALGSAEVAFEGEVTTIGDGAVTLSPTRFFAGEQAEEVRVDQGTTSMRDLVGAVRFEEGGRYLVAANGGEVMVCGFSGPADPQLAGLYEDAFASRPE